MKLLFQLSGKCPKKRSKKKSSTKILYHQRTSAIFGADHEKSQERGIINPLEKEGWINSIWLGLAETLTVDFCG